MLSKEVKQRIALNRRRRALKTDIRVILKKIGVSQRVAVLDSPKPPVSALSVFMNKQFAKRKDIRARLLAEGAKSMQHWDERRRDMTLTPDFPQLESFHFDAIQLFDTKGKLLKTVDGSISANITEAEKQAFDKVFSDKREMKASDMLDTSGLSAMYPAGHWGWKVGGPELNPELHPRKNTDE